jgi:hypothetical protein
MILLVLEAFVNLLHTEWLMRRRGFYALHDFLKRFPPQTVNVPHSSGEQLCHAVDIACVLYLKNVMCLQRSVATAMLLRRHGFPAVLVIGVRVLPFRSHAWVELNGQVVNDKSYVSTIYRELERC